MRFEAAEGSPNALRHFCSVARDGVEGGVNPLRCFRAKHVIYTAFLKLVSQVAYLPSMKVTQDGNVVVSKVREAASLGDARPHKLLLCPLWEIALWFPELAHSTIAWNALGRLPR